MRGDSLRDLCAKSLALAGLALLAGVGALFDYWPIATDIPYVAGERNVAVRGAIPPANITSSPTASIGRERRRPVAPVAPVAAVASGPSLPSATPFTLALGTPVALPRFELAVPVVVVTVQDATADPGLVLAEPPVVPRVGIAEFLAPPVAPQTSESGAVSFVTGALKKTGRTIVSASVKTGASIRDAVLSLGGAFKKVL